ncbi:F-box protein SKIP23 [Olea europaea var. sylvestris]|uniref:F-box protein SKIP23 n=1 Tax=Olea europaea var. sylvestris TaxID=158386 RepID=UPI000C1CF72A|nr:F-box protein SKIP23 [Olea europaea var. sylvestris]
MGGRKSKTYLLREEVVAGRSPSKKRSRFSCYFLSFRRKKWTVIKDFHSPYDDVIFREGRFYAIDNTGRTVVVNLDEGGSPSVSVVAHSIFGGDKKFLVDSFGDLLLVDKYLSVGPEDDLGYIEDIGFYEEFDCYTSERTVKFKVFRLDENAEKWVEVTNLGDKLLFLGDNCTFSASALEVFGDNGCKGNCIFFTDQFFSGREDDWVWKSRGIRVFNLESGRIGPIDSQDGYSDMFWPPPAWVCSNVSVEAELERLAI